jgi:hypothetical protein
MWLAKNMTLEPDYNKHELAYLNRAVTMLWTTDYCAYVVANGEGTEPLNHCNMTFELLSEL